jgi:hypothetical protein
MLPFSLLEGFPLKPCPSSSASGDVDAVTSQQSCPFTEIWRVAEGSTCISDVAHSHLLSAGAAEAVGCCGCPENDKAHGESAVVPFLYLQSPIIGAEGRPTLRTTAALCTPKGDALCLTFPFLGLAPGSSAAAPPHSRPSIPSVRGTAAVAQDAQLQHLIRKAWPSYNARHGMAQQGAGPHLH